MSLSAWLKTRAVELGAALCTAAVLIAGLAIGVPFLRARIPETFLYSVCCVSAVLLRAFLDLVVGCVALAVRSPALPHPRGGQPETVGRLSDKMGPEREISRPLLLEQRTGWPAGQGRTRWGI